MALLSTQVEPPHYLMPAKFLLIMSQSLLLALVLSKIRPPQLESRLPGELLGISSSQCNLGRRDNMLYSFHGIRILDNAHGNIAVLKLNQHRSNIPTCTRLSLHHLVHPR